MKDYQTRLASIVADYGAPQGGEAINAEDYRGKVPDAMLEFWQHNGVGVVLDGYFQFCDPNRYRGVLRLVFDNDPDIRADQTYALGFGSFGTIIAWNETYQDVIIDLVKSRVSCPALVSGKFHDPDLSVTSQLMMLDDPSFDEYDSDVKKLFKRARSKLGKLGVDQIYGFRPVLALGGNRDLTSLSIYDAVPHMAILAQAHEFQLMDDAAYPPQPVRSIGG
ncbi:GAD-like domain-containing protein [Agrobacterium sp. fls2-241-TYG-188a]|uniref:GAD-like domain-containing protein n=1 Tax=Agrobacterium sp. fls2-241-TYG-188a TaxID=3040275 RepID=UPI00254F949B|nr:GAD-like domain-containing protein [Agrobacterium sp. fls2-241-TYG-188a]